MTNFLFHDSIIFHYLYVPLFFLNLLLFLDEYLAWFHVFVSIADGTVNTGVYLFLWYNDFFLLDIYCIINRFARLCASYVFRGNFALFSVMTVNLCSHWKMSEFLSPFPIDICYFCFFDNSHSTWMRWQTAHSTSDLLYPDG